MVNSRKYSASDVVFQALILDSPYNATERYIGTQVKSCLKTLVFIFDMEDGRKHVRCNFQIPPSGHPQQCTRKVHRYTTLSRTIFIVQSDMRSRMKVKRFRCGFTCPHCSLLMLPGFDLGLLSVVSASGKESWGGKLAQ